MSIDDRLPTDTASLRLAKPLEFRAALPRETALVRELDDRVFPPNDNDLQRAPRGELEEAVLAGDVFLLMEGDEAVAYLHVDRSHPDRIYVSGFGVVPESQGHGLGTKMANLMLPLLTEAQDVLPVYTVTSPRNSVMLRFLFARGFAGRWVLPDFFGPGRHRLGLQFLRSESSLPQATVTRNVRLADIYGLQAQIEAGWVIRSMGRTPAGPHFEVVPGEPGADFLPCGVPDPGVY